MRTYDGAAVDEADSIEQALDIAEDRPPSVVIVDPQLGALDVTSALTQLRKVISAPIVVFAVDGDGRMLAEALKSGAKACVQKDSPPEDLTRAIDAARDGAFFIDPALGEVLGAEAMPKRDVLTERQRQIIQMFADGAQTDSVAVALGLSTETVRTHTKRILAKLNAHTRTHAVAVALRGHMIE